MKQKLKLIGLFVFITITLCGCGAKIYIGGIDKVADKVLEHSFEADAQVLNNLKACVGGISQFEVPISAAVIRTQHAKDGVSGFEVTNLLNKATTDGDGLSTFEIDLINSLEIQPMQKVLPQVCGGIFCGFNEVATVQKEFENHFYQQGDIFFRSSYTDDSSGVTPFYAALNGYVSSTSKTDWADVEKLYKNGNAYKTGVNNNSQWTVKLDFGSGPYDGFTKSKASVEIKEPTNLPGSYTFGTNFFKPNAIICGVPVPTFNNTTYCNGKNNAGSGAVNTSQIVDAALATAKLCGITEYTFTRADGSADGSVTVKANITDDDYSIGTAQSSLVLAMFRTRVKSGQYVGCTPSKADKKFANNVVRAIDVIKNATSAPSVKKREVIYRYDTNTEHRSTRIQIEEADSIEGKNLDASGKTAYKEFVLTIGYAASMPADYKPLFKVKVTVSVQEREYKAIYDGSGEEKEFDTYDGVQGLLQLKQNLSAFGKSAISFLSYDYSSNTSNASQSVPNVSQSVRNELIDVINKCNSGNVYVLKARKDSWDSTMGSMMSTLNDFMKKSHDDKLQTYDKYFTGTFGTGSSQRTVQLAMIEDALADNFIIPSSSTAPEPGTDCEVVLNIKGENHSAGQFSINIGSLYKETFNRDYLSGALGYTGYGFLFDVLVPTTANGDQILLLKKYPVAVVSQIQADASTEKYKLKTKDSKMLYDIASGDLFPNRLGNDAVTMTDADAFSNTTNLLSDGQIYGLDSIALAPSSTDNTSVSVKTSITMPKGVKDRMSILDKSGRKVSGTFGFKSHLLLMDYAEGMYAPNVYAGEDIIALGLKLRLDTDWVCKNVPFTWDDTKPVAEQRPYIETSSTFDSIYINDLMGYTNNNASVTGTVVSDTPNVKNDLDLVISSVTLDSPSREVKDDAPSQTTTWGLNGAAQVITASANVNGKQTSKALYGVDAPCINVKIQNIPTNYSVTDVSGAHLLVEDAADLSKTINYTVSVGTEHPSVVRNSTVSTVPSYNVTGYKYNSTTNTADFNATFALPAHTTQDNTFDVSVKFFRVQNPGLELTVKFTITYEYASTTQTAGSGEITKLRSNLHPNEGTDTTIATGHAGVPAYYQDAIETGLLNTNQSKPEGWDIGCAKRETPNSSKTPYVWVMGCDRMSDTFLQTWIAVDPTSGTPSLSKWCEWTASIGLTNYPVDANTTLDDIISQIDDMLHDVYNFADIDVNDTITFDERVIEIITEQIKREQTKEQYRWITTICKIIGIILTVYALALVVAWILDVGSNAEGDGLLYKLSFKKLRAAVDKEAVGSLNNEHSGTKYIAIGALVVRAVILIAFGLILVFVNPIDLVFDIIALVDKFTAWLSDSVFNE